LYLHLLCYGQEPSTINDKLPQVRLEWAVKKYARAAAGQAQPGPEEIRPPHVLKVRRCFF
jgi:hypothetical protein